VNPPAENPCGHLNEDTTVGVLHIAESAHRKICPKIGRVLE
jgi:hypothetical protein